MPSRSLRPSPPPKGTFLPRERAVGAGDLQGRVGGGRLRASIRGMVVVGGAGAPGPRRQSAPGDSGLLLHLSVGLLLRAAQFQHNGGSFGDDGEEDGKGVSAGGGEGGPAARSGGVNEGRGSSFLLLLPASCLQGRHASLRACCSAATWNGDRPIMSRTIKNMEIPLQSYPRTAKNIKETSIYNAKTYKLTISFSNNKIINNNK